MSNRDEIIESFTRTLFVQAYAYFIERSFEDGEDVSDLPSASSGADWMDESPATPEWVAKDALTCIAKIEAHVGETIESMFYYASVKCINNPRQCAKSRHNTDQFGHYLAMQYVGHGVCWADDHAQDFDLPHGEFYIMDRSELA